MEFQCIQVGPLAVNAYLLFDPDRDDALVIDPGAKPDRILQVLDGRKLSGILLTHGHGDHIGAVAALRGPDTPVYIHAEDAAMLTNPSLSLALMTGAQESQGEADVLLGEGPVQVAGIPLEVLHTPGHTPGSVCYRCGDVLFSGDTLFQQGYGRTDLPGGDMRKLGASIRRLMGLPGAMAVYPGHGEHTTIGAEKGQYCL